MSAGYNLSFIWIVSSDPQNNLVREVLISPFRKQLSAYSVRSTVPGRGTIGMNKATIVDACILKEKDISYSQFIYLSSWKDCERNIRLRCESTIIQDIRRSGRKEIIFDEHLCLLSSADHMGEGSVLG